MNDLIRREEVINIIHKKIQDISDFLQHDALIDVEFEVDDLPTIEAVPVEFICDVLLNKYKSVHGEWIAQDEGLTKFMCSVCNGKYHGGHEKFCPDCGAKMDKKDMKKKV